MFLDVVTILARKPFPNAPKQFWNEKIKFVLWKCDVEILSMHEKLYFYDFVKPEYI